MPISIKDISFRSWATAHGGVYVMPDSSLEDARLRVEQIRRLISWMEIRLEGGKIGKIGKITISAGVAQMREGNTTPDQLLRASDQALYTAKAEGRNRVVVSKA